MSRVPPNRASTESTQSHLRKCENQPPESQLSSSTSTSTAKPQQTTLRLEKTIARSDTEKDEFKHDFFRLIVGTNLSFNWSDHPYVRWFFAKWVPGVDPPHRTALSTTKIATEIQKLDLKLEDRIRGEAVTLTADAWNSISKKHLMGFVVNVGGEVSRLLLRQSSLFRELTKSTF